MKINLKELEKAIIALEGIELTEAGNILYKYTSSAMELLETGLLRIEALKSLDEGELKIGASDSISTHFLLPRLEMFHKLYPNIKIKIINRVTNETIELLKSGKLANINEYYK